jgi:crotonobetainyl-CoA:carnitine CoA-transferase CaiB-like acyl-CoA transferase
VLNWLETLWAHDIPAQPARPLGRLFFDEQAAANGYVVDVDDPLLGRTRQAGMAFTITPATSVRG